MKEGVEKYPVRIKIMGVGGAGGNTVNRIMMAGLIDPSEVDIISLNTDLQVLRETKAPIAIQLGPKTTKGQGSGGDPAKGRLAAEESIDTIKDLLTNCDMLFLTCGMGKGTGTGATPLIASVAKEMEILTVAVVTKPFTFEGKQRMENAEKGISELKKYVDALLVIPNDKFMELYPDLSFSEVLYRVADDVLHKAVVSMWNVIRRPGFMNVDYADARNVLKSAGDIIMSTAVEHSATENSLKKAIKKAIYSPFVDVNMQGAKKLLMNICGKNIIMNDVKIASEYLQQFMDKEAAVVIGYVNSDEFEENVEVTIIASGFQTIPEKVKSKKYARNTKKVVTDTTSNIEMEIIDTKPKKILRSINKSLRVLK